MTRSRIQPTLLRRAHPLASSARQQALLRELPLALEFDGALAGAGFHPLRAAGIQVLQINLGKRCNQTCAHCHVDAGPERTESMNDEIVDACFRVLQVGLIPILDITGGAPELHPRFHSIVERAYKLHVHVMDRCNLTILEVAGFHDLPEFLAEHQVEIVASLPWYSEKLTDAQRGASVFESSLHALRRLNELGYGKEGSGLLLHLVTNPVGAFLPANQKSLERDWKRQLQRRYSVTFNQLYTITNMPISRFLEFLLESGNLSSYMQKLVNAFNPAAVPGLMCRTMLSVGWNGKLYDCDFNQMLDMALPRNIVDVKQADLAALKERTIQTGRHCFGCTAGSGSSCGGATT